MPRRDVKLRIDKALATIKELPPTSTSPNLVVDLTNLAKDPAVRQVFDAAGRDPTMIGNWLTIFVAMANGRFGPAGHGAERVWDSALLSSLLANFLRLRKNYPTLSDSQLCNMISKNIVHFAKNRASRLRRMLSDALDPAKNLLLKHVLAGFPPEVLQADQKHRRRKISLEELPDRWDEARAELALA
jgi:hypothetical protein